jgi:hypothetical protein
MKPFSVLALLFASYAGIGQDIKSLEYAKQYQKQQVQSKKCMETIFSGNVPQDTIMQSFEEYDRMGRILRYIEYDRKSAPIAEYHYEYDAKGNMKMSVTHRYSDWQEIELVGEYDDRKRLVSRTPLNKPDGFWEKETFNYDAGGKLLSRDQWYFVDGVLKPVMNKSFPQSVEKNENSLSYIFDEHDLLIIEQLYRGGVSDKSRNFYYTFY